MMAQANPAKKSNTFERMNGSSQLLFSNKITHSFTKWTTPSGFLKKYNYLYKKFDASNKPC